MKNGESFKCKHLAKNFSKYPFTVKKNQIQYTSNPKRWWVKCNPISCPFDSQQTAPSFHIFHTLNNFLSDFEFKKPIHKVLLF